MNQRARKTCLGILLWWCVAALPASAGTANRIVAVVNDEIITQAELSHRVQQILEDGDLRLPPGAGPEQLEQAVLRNLIEQRLIVQEAKKLGIEADQEEISERWRSFRAQFKSEEHFRAWLQDQRLSEPELKRQLRDQLLVQRAIQEKVKSTVTVSPQEVDRELDALPDHQAKPAPAPRAKASHILVRVTADRSEDDTRALAESLRERIAGGEGFAEVAKAHSEDARASEGGSLGWVVPGQLLPEIDDALFALKPGELSPVIQTSLGFHLVRLEDLRAPEASEETDPRQAAHRRVYERKFEEAMGRWLTQLQEKAYIEVEAIPPDG